MIMNSTDWLNKFYPEMGLCNNSVTANEYKLMNLQNYIKPYNTILETIRKN